LREGRHGDWRGSGRLDSRHGVNDDQKRRAARLTPREIGFIKAGLVSQDRRQ